MWEDTPVTEVAVSGPQAVGEAIARVAGRVGRSVVGIGGGWGGGSGVVVAPGLVLATERAGRGAEMEVMFVGGRRAPAAALGSDGVLGIAVLGCDTRDAPPVEWAADPAAARIGTPVLAVANPGGRGLWTTLGALAREPAEEPARWPGRGAARLEHTAPLPRGSAGSALTDLEGDLMGVNVARLGEGFCLALAATPALRERLEALAAGESRPRARLGLALAPAHVARRLRRAAGLPEVEGLLVRGVSAGGAAERAGLREGDVLTAADERPVTTVAELRAALESSAPGRPLALSVVRGVEQRTALVTPDEGRGTDR
jgi:S1-C subfamily serine protease